MKKKKKKRIGKCLREENMMKTQKKIKDGVRRNVIKKKKKNEHVSTEVICKICETLGCNVDDIIEFIPEDK